MSGHQNFKICKIIQPDRPHAPRCLPAPSSLTAPPSPPAPRSLPGPRSPPAPLLPQPPFSPSPPFPPAPPSLPVPALSQPQISPSPRSPPAPRCLPAPDLPQPPGLSEMAPQCPKSEAGENERPWEPAVPSTRVNQGCELLSKHMAALLWKVLGRVQTVEAGSSPEAALQA